MQQEILKNKVKGFGLDFGTTYCCVAIWKDGQPIIVPNDHGSLKTPSYVAFTEDQILVGEVARMQTKKNPTNTIYDLKVLLTSTYSENHEKFKKMYPFKIERGANDKILIVVTHQGVRKLYSIPQLLSFLFLHLKNLVEKFTGHETTQMVITTSPFMGEIEKAALRKACSLSKLEVLRQIDGCYAAALWYSAHKTKTTQPNNNMIVDFGGGNITCCCFVQDGGVCEIGAVTYLRGLGGEYLDSLLQEQIIRRFEAKTGLKIQHNQKALHRLKIEVKKLKRSLSSSHEQLFEIDSLHEGHDLSLKITRADFQALCIPHLSSVNSLIEQAMKKDTCYQKIEKFILIGGSSRIPLFNEMISKHFQKIPAYRKLNPDESCAAGAAIMTAILSGTQDQSIETLLLIAEIPYSIGILQKDSAYYPLIKSLTTIPTKKTHCFTTTRDNQTQFLLQIYESQHKQVKQNKFIGGFMITGIQMAAKGVPRILISCYICERSFVQLQVEQRKTGLKALLKITGNENMLTRDQIEKEYKPSGFWDLENIPILQQEQK